MDFDTFDTDIFSEINDSQAEIYDVIEYNEDGKDDDNKFDVEGYINGNTDYWEKCYSGQPPVDGCRSGTRFWHCAQNRVLYLKIKQRNQTCVRSKPRWTPPFRTISGGHRVTPRSSLVGRALLMFISTGTESQPLVTPGFKSLMVGIKQRQQSHVWMLYFLPSEWMESIFFKRTFSGSLTIRDHLSPSLTACAWHKGLRTSWQGGTQNRHSAQNRVL